MIAIIIAILLILAALRMSRYKTDLSLRIFTLVYLPSVLINNKSGKCIFTLCIKKRVQPVN